MPRNVLSNNQPKTKSQIKPDVQLVRIANQKRFIQSTVYVLGLGLLFLLLGLALFTLVKTGLSYYLLAYVLTLLAYFTLLRVQAQNARLERELNLQPFLLVHVNDSLIALASNEQHTLGAVHFFTVWDSSHSFRLLWKSGQLSKAFGVSRILHTRISAILQEEFGVSSGTTCWVEYHQPSQTCRLVVEHDEGSGFTQVLLEVGVSLSCLDQDSSLELESSRIEFGDS